MEDWISVCDVDQLQREKVRVVHGSIAVFASSQGPVAIDNRCPHMGFPLHMGTICDGLLTCHWHHARFDLNSGGTLDPWADDVPRHDVKVEGDRVYVHIAPSHRRGIEAHRSRLREGLEQNISLIIAKSVVALLEAGESPADIARSGALFGATQRARGWSSGLTILAAMVNICPRLDRYGQILALFQGLTHVAQDCANSAPLYPLTPLPQPSADLPMLQTWYRQSVEVRDPDGAQRVLRAAIRQAQVAATDATALTAAALRDMMLTAATDHVYLDGGHTFDFHNKAFELLDIIGDDAQDVLLCSLTPLFANPTRSEELQNWQRPIDLVTPMAETFARLGWSGDAHDQPRIATATANAAADARGQSEEALVSLLLADDPIATLAHLEHRVQAGAPLARLAQGVALAAAMRVLRFHVQNDFSDWISVLHTFTHAHAVHASLRRGAAPIVGRAVMHGAMQVYLDRFLNIPQASLPSGERARKQGYTTALDELLNLLNSQQQVASAADWVAQYLDEGKDVAALFNALGHALLREDAEFHSFQMYEAALAEYDWWGEDSTEFAAQAQRTIILALTRYLAAHAPTARELPNIVRIAWRLQHGEKLFEAADVEA